MPLRVAGTDPGTSSLDVLVLEDGAAGDQVRFQPEQLRDDPGQVIRWLEDRGPFALVAAPSGYGLPLVRGQDCSEDERRLMSLVRRDDPRASGVMGFSQLVEAFCASSLPAVFLPGVIHLDTVPAHRKYNRIDLGTADKVAAAALALAQMGRPHPDCSFCLVELGSAFTACIVAERGRIVAGLGGTSGPAGWQSGGAWDGELAYLAWPLSKSDLFTGGVESISQAEDRAAIFTERITAAVAGLLAVHDVERIVLSGRLFESQPELSRAVECGLQRLRPVGKLENLPGAWVKHAAQGAALIADGLAGGQFAPLVQSLRIGEARGSILDGVLPPYRGRLAELASAAR